MSYIQGKSLKDCIVDAKTLREFTLKILKFKVNPIAFSISFLVDYS